MNKWVLLTGVALLALAGSLWATTTTVYNTTWNFGPWNEWNLESGLPNPGTNYGGQTPPAYSPNNILDYYYTSWTRIDDDWDQLWWDMDGGIEVKAKYTSSSLYLGYAINEVSGSPVTPLYQTSGDGNTLVNAPGDKATLDLANNDAFLWVVQGAGTLYSRQSLNSGGTDRMVTYLVDGIYTNPVNHGAGYVVPDDPTFVIGFEDGTDFDYQDFVVEVSRITPGTVGGQQLVPEPLTVLGVLLGVGGVGAYIRRRRMA
jgi:hypothetical protein